MIDEPDPDRAEWRRRVEDSVARRIADLVVHEVGPGEWTLRKPGAPDEPQETYFRVIERHGRTVVLGADVDAVFRFSIPLIHKNTVCGCAERLLAGPKSRRRFVAGEAMKVIAALEESEDREAILSEWDDPRGCGDSARIQEWTRAWVEVMHDGEVPDATDWSEEVVLSCLVAKKVAEFATVIGAKYP